MAVSFVPLAMKLELPSESVQELLKTAKKQVPERYIYQLSEKSSADHSDIKYMDSPIIDLSLLSSASSHQLQKELCKHQTTLSSWGCFQLINHGLSSLLLNQIREVGKEFFDLPLEVKQKHCRTLYCFEGYGGDTVSENQSYNWNDRLQLKVHPLEQQNFKLWPDYVPNFRLSNGILKSVVHKVVIDKEKERTSVAMQCSPHFDREIGPLSELIDKEKPQLYKKIKDYRSVYFQYYPRGERAITEMKLQTNVDV